MSEDLGLVTALPLTSKSVSRNFCFLLCKMDRVPSISRAVVPLTMDIVPLCATLQFTKHNEEQRSFIVSKDLQLLMVSDGLKF